MKYRTETVREGENLGPIDWSYNFRQHFDSMCAPDAARDEACERAKAVLKAVETAKKEGKEVKVWASGNFLHRVLDVGMYDGWPFWKPTPYVLLDGPLGVGDWTPFYNLLGVAE